MLTVEHGSRHSFLDLLSFIIQDMGVDHVHFSRREPIGKGAISLMKTPALDIPLSGRKHMQFADNGHVVRHFLHPGDVHYAAPLHWKKPLWDSLHEMSSVVYFPDYIRLTYINFERVDPYYSTHPADVFYHTTIPLDAAGVMVLETLTFMADSGQETGAAGLMRSLLEITRETVRRNAAERVEKPYRMYLTIRQYVQSNFDAPLTRDSVACLFRITPSYVSQLFGRYGNEGFNATLRRLRLEHAAVLLQQTELTVEEICYHCGYQSSTYFISAFHRHFGSSPGRYRLLEGTPLKTTGTDGTSRPAVQSRQPM